jgi:Fe2+ transport system protein FeoA
MLTLSQVANGHPVVVRTLAIADAQQARYLEALGILPGRVLVVERSAPFGGPVMVRVGDARYALGRSLSDQILVEPEAA